MSTTTGDGSAGGAPTDSSPLGSQAQQPDPIASAAAAHAARNASVRERSPENEPTPYVMSGALQGEGDRAPPNHSREELPPAEITSGGIAACAEKRPLAQRIRSGLKGLWKSYNDEQTKPSAAGLLIDAYKKRRAKKRAKELKKKISNPVLVTLLQPRPTPQEEAIDCLPEDDENPLPPSPLFSTDIRQETNSADVLSTSHVSRTEAEQETNSADVLSTSRVSRTEAEQETNSADVLSTSHVSRTEAEQDSLRSNDGIRSGSSAAHADASSVLSGGSCRFCHERGCSCFEFAPFTLTQMPGTMRSTSPGPSGVVHSPASYDDNEAQSLMMRRQTSRVARALNRPYDPSQLGDPAEEEQADLNWRRQLQDWQATGHVLASTAHSIRREPPSVPRPATGAGCSPRTGRSPERPPSNS